MILRAEVVRERLRELEEVTQTLDGLPRASLEELEADVPRRWTIERGLIAAANLVFDVADHILAGHFGSHPATYEGALRALRDRDVVSADLFAGLEGFGGMRNVFVHMYTDIDPEHVAGHHEKAPHVLRQFVREVLEWLGGLEGSET